MSERQSSDHEYLRFSSAVLRLLGEELNPNPNQGIVELVKNAYDADATWCRVEFEGEHLPRGKLRIRDNGDGMTLNDIRSGWLIVGESRKRATGISRGKKRLVVGSKGLGRLAALRLGQRATLVTRPREEPNIEYRLVLDWESYQDTDAVDEVPLSVETSLRELGAQSGSEIEIAGLHEAWTPAGMRRLARTLHLLSDPFAAKSAQLGGANFKSTDFKVTLETDAFKQVVEEASADYWTHCDYHLEAGVNANGKAWAKVRDATNRILFEAEHDDIAGKSRALYLVPQIEFELWEFKLDSKKFATTTISKSALNKWLGEFGGVHLYYRGVRVAPYGDQGNDWLDINLGRARSPEERPSTNNSIGRVRIDDPEALLLQKTDRQGFVENETFGELREVARDAIDWMQRQRLKKRDLVKRGEKKTVVEAKERSEDTLKAEVAKLPELERRPVLVAVENHLKAVAKAVNVLEIENQLYHTLGTIGTTASAFAHQSEKPLDLIQENSQQLETLLGDPSNPSFPTMSLETLRSIRTAARALLAFSTVTLKLLEHEKRGKGRQRLHSLITEIADLLLPYLQSRDTEVETDFMSEEPVVYGSRAAIESIFTNLIINSLRAFARDYGDQHLQDDATINRRILIRTRKLSDRVRITFVDNGPGIRDMALEDIWLVGKSSTPKGSGLGLCIVRDTIDDMGGTISAEAFGELGGAEFVIELPLCN